MTDPFIVIRDPLIEAAREAQAIRQTVAIVAAVLIAQRGGNGGVYSHEEIAREAWELYGAVADLAPEYSK